MIRMNGSRQAITVGLLALAWLSLSALQMGCERQREPITSDELHVPKWPAPTRLRALSELDRYTGRDLRQLPPAEIWRVHELLDVARPLPWQPLSVLKVHHVDRVFAVVLEFATGPAAGAVNTPDTIRVNVFNPDGDPGVLFPQEIRCGWASGSTLGSSVEAVGVAGSPTENQMILIRSAGGPYPRQYYGFNGPLVVLVRIEDEQGRLVRNDYTSWLATIGEAHRFSVGYHRENFLRELERGSRCDKLSAVEWLIGQRSPSTEAAERVAGVLRDLQVQAALHRFAQGDDPWLKEAASVALGLPPTRP